MRTPPPSRGRPRGAAREAALPQQRPWAQPRMRYAPDRGRLGRRARIDPPRLAAGARGDRDGLPRRRGPGRPARGRRARSSRLRSASGSTGHGRSSGSGRRRRRSRSMPEPGARPRDRRRLDGLRVRRAARRTSPTSTAAGGSATGPTTRTCIRLCQMLNAVHFFAGYPVEPIDIHAVDPPPRCAYDLLTLADKPSMPTALGRQRNHRRARDGRASRAASTTRRSTASRRCSRSSTRARRCVSTRRCSTASSRCRRATRSSCMTPFTLAGRDGAGDARRRPRRAERRGARRHRPDPGRTPGRAGRLRRVHLERRHAVGRAGVRDARVHADRDDRRPAGPALRLAVPLVERVRRQRASTPRPPTSRCSRCGARSWAGSTW